MKAILPYFILFLITNIHSQSTGYLGKKFIIKTNVINGKDIGFNNLDFEIVLARRASLNLSGQTFNYLRSETGVSVRTGKVRPGSNRDKMREVTTLRNGHTKGWILSMGFKKYFNTIIPAPVGYYVEANLGFGSATYSGYDVTYDYKKAVVYGTNTEIYPKKPITNLSGKSTILFFELPSFGYQKIFKRLISLDAKIALQGQYCLLPELMLNALEHNYFVRTNTIGYGYNNLQIGPAVYIKLGVLLF